MEFGYGGSLLMIAGSVVTGEDTPYSNLTGCIICAKGGSYGDSIFNRSLCHRLLRNEQRMPPRLLCRCIPTPRLQSTTTLCWGHPPAYIIILAICDRDPEIFVNGVLATWRQRIFPMLHCTNCIRTCLRDFISQGFAHYTTNTAAVSRPLLRYRKLQSQVWSTRRGYRTATRAGRPLASQKPRIIREKDPEEGSNISDFEQEQRKKKWAIDEELKYLRDPLKLSENTTRLLRAGDRDKALELARAISKYGSYVVTWNHLIDFEMSQKRVGNAMELFNDVCRSPTILCCSMTDHSR